LKAGVIQAFTKKLLRAAGKDYSHFLKQLGV
jgi:hypothetical protein